MLPNISIHAPYKRVRPLPTIFRNLLFLFQSTHPTRECDAAVTVPLTRLIYFNPRTLQESATMLHRLQKQKAQISIHAPYKRVRRPAVHSLDYPAVFQSTHPTRECDTQQFIALTTQRYFNPRTLQESATPYADS